MYRGEVCSDARVAASAAELFRFGPRREQPSTEVGPPLVAKRVRKKNRRFFEGGDDYASEIPRMTSGTVNRKTLDRTGSKQFVIIILSYGGHAIIHMHTVYLYSLMHVNSWKT